MTFRLMSLAENGWIAWRTLTFSFCTSEAWNEIGGSIADEREQLEHVVLHDVAQGAGLVVVAAARPDADVFGNRHLHVVHVATVPDWLEDAVREPEREDVLNGFLARGSDRCG